MTDEERRRNTEAVRRYRATAKGRDAQARANERYERSYKGSLHRRKKRPNRVRDPGVTAMAGAKWRSSNPHKWLAHAAIMRAVKGGRISIASERRCAMHDVPAEQYHHWSYESEHRLDVVPLCVGCHKRLHRGGLSA